MPRGTGEILVGILELVQVAISCYLIFSSSHQGKTLYSMAQ